MVKYYEIEPNNRGDYIFFVSGGNNDDYYVVFYFEEDSEGLSVLSYKKFSSKNITISKPIEHTTKPYLIEKKVIDVHVENGKRTQKENTTYIIYLENPMDYIKVVGNANYN